MHFFCLCKSVLWRCSRGAKTLVTACHSCETALSCAPRCAPWVPLRMHVTIVNDEVDKKSKMLSKVSVAAMHWDAMDAFNCKHLQGHKDTCHAFRPAFPDFSQSWMPWLYDPITHKNNVLAAAERKHHKRSHKPRARWMCSKCFMLGRISLHETQDGLAHGAARARFTSRLHNHHSQLSLQLRRRSHRMFGYLTAKLSKMRCKKRVRSVETIPWWVQRPVQFDFLTQSWPPS